MTAPIGITLGFEGVQKFQADGRIAATTVDNIGVSARQTAAALRGVPAQFTDIITSLQGGQAPLTVFLQQGGQLRDMFGGAGAAAKALGGYVVGLVNPFTVAAAAGVALGVAYNQGSKEADLLTKSIALTGNAAGVTTAQLQGMSAQVSNIIGTQGKAADVLAQMVGTGRVGRESLEQFTATAIRMERSVGVAVKDTVKEFAELGKAPVEASKQLNERYNYLTAAVYEQIKALQEQGKAQEAAALAQQSYDKAMANVATTVETRLGYLEKAWRGVGDGAKWAWDQMLNVGRGPTDADNLAQLRQNLSRQQERNASLGIKEGQATADLKEQIRLLERKIAMDNANAAGLAEKARAERGAIAASDELDRIQSRGLTRLQLMNKELDAYYANLDKERATNPSSSRLTAEAIARGEKAIRDQFKETSTGAPRAGESETASLKARADAAEKYLEQLRATGEEAKKLTAGEQRAAEIREQLNGSITGQARREKELALVQAERLGIAERATVTEQDRIKSNKESEASYRKYLDAIGKTGDAYGEMAERQEAANASFGKSKVAIEEAALAQQKFYLASAKDAGPWTPEMISQMERAVVLQERWVDSLKAGEGKVLNARADELLRAAQEMSKLYADEAQLAGLTGLERAKITAQRQIELKYAKELADIDKMTATTDAQILAKETARNKVLQAKRIEGEAAVAKAIQDDWTRTTDEINRSLTDALLRGFESGKGFAENLRDTLKNMFNTLVLRPIISAVLSPISGAIGGALGGGSAGGGGGGVLGMASNAFSLYNTGSQAWTLGSQYLGGTMSGANALGTMWANGTGGGLDALLATNGAYGTAGTGAGGAGMSGMAGAGVFAAVAAVILNGLGAFRSDRRVASGLRGTLGSGDITPWEEWREGGTLFSGPEYTTFNPLEALTRERARLQELKDMGADPTRIMPQQMIVDNLEEQYGGMAETAKKQSDYIQKTFGAMKDSAMEMGKALGLNTDKLKDFTTQLGGSKGINLEGLKPEEAQAKIAEALATANNEIAQQIIGTWETTTTEATRIVAENIGSYGEDAQMVYTELTDTITKTRYVASEYAKEGEQAIDTLTRLATSLTTVNSIWDQLGYTLLDASLKGADAASRIADAFGGLEAMTAATGSYFQNFYSGDERREAQSRALQGELDKYGIKLPDIDAPDARAQYRALAEAQDRNTEEGLKAYVAMIQLSGAFASITTEAEDATQAINRQRESAYDALERAVAAERKVLQSQLDVARDVASTLDGLFGILHSNVRDLYGEVDSTRGMLASQGNDFITKALATAQKSGYLPDADKLADAISAARGGIDAGGYTSQFAQDRDRLVLAGKLAGLERITEKQLTDAQRTVKALEQQIEQGDQVLDFWRQQIELATGTNEAILSVEAAIKDLQRLVGGGGGAVSNGGRTGNVPGSGAGAAWKRTSYGADEALESFDKFKDWYNGLRGNANTAAMTDGGYKVPDWLRLSGMAADGTDAGMFEQYQFFKNNPQYAKDYEQVMTTGRSSYGTDGTTLIRSDISKMPADAAEYYKNNPNALLMAEGFLLDPVLAYQLYRDGPERFGIDRSKISFTEWLRSSQWSEEGVKPGDGSTRYSQMDYANYNLTKRDPMTGNLVGRDGIIYTSEGKAVGRASNELMMSLYGMPAPNKPASYISDLRQTFDKDIADGKTGQQLADKIRAVGASMSDVAAAYGISVETLKENLKIAGATNIPAFAGGGLHAGGLRIVGERGWEVEATGPARIWNQDQLSRALGGGDTSRLEALVEQLVAQVAALEAVAQATASNTAGLPQMTDQFDTVTSGGNALRNQPVPA